MSAVKNTPSAGREDTRQGRRNYPRGVYVPRRYKTRESAESVAALYSRMSYFSARGKPYSYACSVCRCFHVGLDTSEPWHECRSRHDQHEDYAGERPESDAA